MESAVLETPEVAQENTNEVTRPNRKASYAIASCARCGQPIPKGTEIELWTSGPRYGSQRRWVHVGCVATEATAKAVAVDTEMVKQLVADAMKTLDLSNLDLSGLEGSLAASFAQIKAELQGDYNQQLIRYGQELGAATSESCAALAEAVQGEMTSLFARVQECVESGVKHVHEIKKWDGTVVTLDEHTHVAFEEVLQLAAVREEIFLPGPAGCGKTHLAAQVATALSLRFGFISCSSGMSEGQMTARFVPAAPSPEQVQARHASFVKLGFSDEIAATLSASMAGNFTTVMSQFADFYENGGVFLIDEIDAADSNLLLVINSALSNGKMALPNRPDKPWADRHPDFVCIAAANTYGRGADRLYVGRNQLDEATLDRFRMGVVPMDYDTQLEAKLCPNKAIRESLQKIRDAAVASKMQRIVSTRFLVKAHKMHTAAGWSLDKIKSKLVAGWTPDEMRKAGL